MLHFLTLLLQADVVKDVAGYLTPFNTAFATLIWWRVTQLEKQVGKLDEKLYQLNRNMKINDRRS